MPMTFATATHTGLVRRSNEDSYLARPPVFVVADGMGGAQAGEVASAMAVRAFEYFLPQSSRPEEELAKLIARANAGIHDYAMGGSGRAGMGTTITAATVKGDSVSIAHVGDSRAWLLRKGELTRLTEDHSLVAELVREGQITEAEAADHPQRSIITRALGVEPTVEVDTSQVKWQPRDIFLLASDGLYSMVSEAELPGLISDAADLGEAACALIEAANARGGNDNITIVLFSPDGSIPGAAEQKDSGTHAAAAIAASTGDNEPADIEGASILETQAAPSSLMRLKSFMLSTIPGNLTMIFVALVLAIGGIWGAGRFVYYVNVEGDNVAIYQGIPYQLGPLSFSSLYRASAVKIYTLEPFEQDRVNEGNLQTKSSAEKMLDNIIISDKRRKEEENRALKEQEQEKAETKKVPTLPID